MSLGEPDEKVPDVEAWALKKLPREVADYIEGMKARGARLVFASDHSISTNTRYESYLYALQVYREHMLY